jgi:hypothetical protein
VQLLGDDGMLRIAAHDGFEQDFLDFFREVSPEDPASCGRSLRTGQRVIVEDVETDDDFAPLCEIAKPPASAP